MSERLLSTLRGVERDLGAAGVPALSDYWRGEVERFYSHPTAKLLVEMVGRGGDKSRTSAVTAIVETLAGDFNIPPGERHYYSHVSENKDEAAKTLGVLEGYLKILGIGHARAGDTIELSTLPRGFKVLAARVGAVSGWRCFGWTADEAAKWDDEGSDPCQEIIASIRAMTATHPTARGRMISSPTGASGYFYDTWSAGDGYAQLAGHAPSWVGNAAITEALTHELEPHEPTWRREYGAVASSGNSAGLSADDVAVMARKLESGAFGLGAPVMLIDSSSGRGDGWAFCCIRHVRDGSRRVLYVDYLGAFEGRFSESVSFDAVVAHVADLAKRNGATRVFGDQYESYSLESGFARHGLAFIEKRWEQPSKIEALSTLRRLLKERTVAVEPGEQADLLKRELVSLREVLLPSKVFTVAARRTGKGHSDRASLMLMAARLVAEGELHGTLGDPTLIPSSAGPSPNSPRAIPLRAGGGFQDWGPLLGGPGRPAAEPLPFIQPRAGFSPGGIPWGRPIVPRGWHAR
jgi:hypothetical protein